MVRASEAAGPLVIIGGAEDQNGEARILREFLRLAGGVSSRVLVITVASEAQMEVGQHYSEIFNRLGAEEVRALAINKRGEANSRAAVEAVERATGVFFTGGNQLRITRLLGGTKLDTLLHKRNEKGLVLAGTSAGAAMMSTVMVIGGRPEPAFRISIAELSPGMGFIEGVLIDQHFEERGRLRRLLLAVAHYPHEIGLGVDENTAVIARDQMLEVIGHGSVTIIDAGEMSYTNLASINKDDILTLCGIKIHILAEGNRFDLRNRTPLIESDSQEIEKTKETKSAENRRRAIFED